MESLEDLLLNASDIHIIIEKAFTVKCCVRGHHVYQNKWKAKVGSRLKACHETTFGALVEDETQGCDCWTCTKVSIKHKTNLP